MKKLHQFACDYLLIAFLFIVLIVGIICFSKSANTLEFIFTYALICVAIITFYIKLRGKVDEEFFKAIRAVFLTSLVLMPAMTFVSERWPILRPTLVQNIKAHQIGSVSILPEEGAFTVKNYSRAYVKAARVRHWFISAEEGGSDAVSLSYSDSDEDISFAPEESRSFSFRTAAATKRLYDAGKLHHCHLIVLLNYKPMVFWPIRERIWAVFYYEPATGRWVEQRKHHKGFKVSFAKWCHDLEQGKQSIPFLPKPEGVLISQEVKTQ